MFDAEEEYVMDFKAEEKRTQLVHFHLDDAASDCSTISASEVDSYDANDSTPPLFYKLKKVRVLIKKLPRDILAKYKISYNEAPLRSSGRIKSKHNPVGKYLALHKNKPLEKVLKKENRRTPNLSNIVENTRLEKNAGCRPLELSNVSSSSKLKNVATPKNISNKGYSLNSGKHLYNKFKSISVKNDYKNKASSHITSTPNVNNKIKAIPSSDARSLQERVATTRLIQKPTEASLPNLPEVVITRYDVPPTPRNEKHVEKTVPNSISRNILQNDKRFIPPYPKLHCSQNVQSKVFPAFITTAPSVNQNRKLTPSNAEARVSNIGLQCPSLPAQRKFTIQAFKIPNDPSKTKDPIPVSNPRVFVVNQSLLGIDPLNMPNSEAETTKNTERILGKGNKTANNTDICVDSDSDSEQADVEKQIEPEVIKRIIYHTKAVQTKFTCNSSICGLVDSDGFNLNCFYCYDIFPLHKWYEFKEHIKVVHHVEERANLLDSDVESDNVQFQNRQENCSNTLFSPIPNTTQQFSNKLPLEPRLLAERQNELITEPSKLFSSTPKTPKSLQIKKKSGNSRRSLLIVNNRSINEVINIDSDDGGDFDGINKTTKTNLLQTEKSVMNKNSQSVNKAQANDSKIVLPSMPHITIKKVDNAVPQKMMDTSRTAAEPLPLNENFVKSSIQRLIKTIPKPTENQLSTNGDIKPRYFVVKKIIKLPATDEISNVSDLNIPNGTILKKIPLDTKIGTSMEYINSIEDSAPESTSGLGILFGSTNSMVVIEFLLKLKAFPELWRNQLKNGDPVKYNESIKKLCLHLNNRFDLNLTDFEMLLSIQRVKDWYHLMLQSIHEHYKDPSNTKPYQHRFPIYFKILSQYLTPNPDEKGVRLNEIINDANLKEKDSLNANKTKTQAPIENMSTTELSKVCSSTASITSPSKDCSQDQEVSTDAVIEFDADTLYDQESSEEALEPKFVKTTIKKTTNADGTERKRTKVYTGRFECDICNKIFKRRCDLRRHKVLHFPPQFECDLCSQKYYFKYLAEKCIHVSRSSYKRVDKTSSEKRVWPKKIFTFNMICEICGNSYRSIGSLNTHKKDKHFNKRDRCIVCNFTALSNWRIVQHQRKRHIVEPGLPEDVAKKSRARTETKTTFSNEARQAFDWRREMRKKMKPGEKFFGCCRCKIIFNTRKEKVLHNKIEHPITEETVVCLLCLPNKLLLSNAGSVRRHYIDIHKVPWHDIDALVKSTKPIFKFLNTEEIELLRASENYKELLDELLKDKKLQPDENVQVLDDEASKAVQNLPHIKELDGERPKTEVKCPPEEENVYVFGITDNDHYSESNYKQVACVGINEHDYSEEHIISERFNEFSESVDNRVEEEFYSQQPCEAETVQVNADIENNDCNMGNYVHNDHEYHQTIVEEYVGGEFIEESIVVEEYIDEIIGEDEVELV